MIAKRKVQYPPFREQLCFRGGVWMNLLETIGRCTVRAYQGIDEKKQRSFQKRPVNIASIKGSKVIIFPRKLKISSTLEDTATKHWRNTITQRLCLTRCRHAKIMLFGCEILISYDLTTTDRDRTATRADMYRWLYACSGDPAQGRRTSVVEGEPMIAAEKWTCGPRPAAADQGFGRGTSQPVS